MLLEKNLELGKMNTTRPRQQVIDAFQEGEGRLLKEFGLDQDGLAKRNFIECVFNVMKEKYDEIGNLDMLLAGCKTIVEFLEKD